MNIGLSGLANNQKLKAAFCEPVKVPCEYGLVDCSPVVKFEGTMRKSDDDFLLEGSLESDVLLTCGKCLTDVSISLSSAVFERFSAKQDSDASGEEEIWHIQSLSGIDINVQKMGYLGVVTGVGGGNFNPTDTITRQEAAVMLARLAVAHGWDYRPEAAPTFADNAQIASWAMQSVGQVQTAGLMGGVGNNNFNPLGTFTREQSIITMLRFLVG